MGEEELLQCLLPMEEFDIDVDNGEDPIKHVDIQDITVTVKNDGTGKRVSDADVK